MDTTVEDKIIAIPMEFMDEPNGDADMVLEYQGCPLVTIRGTDDMSCIEEEDEEKFRLEQLAIAKYVRTAVNSHYDLIEEVSAHKKAYDAVCKRVDDINEQKADLVEALQWALGNLNQYDKPSSEEIAKYNKAVAALSKATK